MKKRHWNFRVATKEVELPEQFASYPGQRWRQFLVIEVHYNEDGVPDSYSSGGVSLSGFEEFSDLKWNINKIKLAFKKPILDLDNFPNEYDKSKI